MKAFTKLFSSLKKRMSQATQWALMEARRSRRSRIQYAVQSGCEVTVNLPIHNTSIRDTFDVSSGEQGTISPARTCDGIHTSTTTSQFTTHTISTSVTTSNLGTSEALSTNLSVKISHRIAHVFHPVDPNPAPSLSIPPHAITSEPSPVADNAAKSLDFQVESLPTPTDTNSSECIGTAVNTIEPGCTSLERQRIQEVDEKPNLDSLPASANPHSSEAIATPHNLIECACALLQHQSVGDFDGKPKVPVTPIDNRPKIHDPDDESDYDMISHDDSDKYMISNDDSDADMISDDDCAADMISAHDSYHNMTSKEKSDNNMISESPSTPTFGITPEPNVMEDNAFDIGRLSPERSQVEGFVELPADPYPNPNAESDYDNDPDADMISDDDSAADTIFAHDSYHNMTSNDRFDENMILDSPSTPTFALTPEPNVMEDNAFDIGRSSPEHSQGEVFVELPDGSYPNPYVLCNCKDLIDGFVKEILENVECVAQGTIHFRFCASIRAHQRRWSA